MKILTINGHIALNCGSNNRSHGMEAIIFNPKKTRIKEIQAMPGVFLHPTMLPNVFGIFALLGNRDQFDAFFKDAKEIYCSKKAVKQYGLPPHNDEEAWSKIHILEEKLWDEFKPWYYK